MMWHIHILHSALLLLEQRYAIFSKFAFANDCRMKHKWFVLMVTAVCLSQVVAQNDRLQRAGRNKDGILKIKREGFFDGEGEDSDEPVSLNAEVIEIVQAPDLSGGPLDGQEENDIEPEDEPQEEIIPETTEPHRELTPEEKQGGKNTFASY